MITYYTATMTGPFTETVTLNGTTAVATAATNICFIDRMSVVSVGSTESNVGTLTLFVNNAGGGGTIGTISVGTLVAGLGDNQTFWAHRYVAVDKTDSLTTLVASAVSGGSGTSATFFLRARNPLVATSPWTIRSDLLLVDGATVRTLGIAIEIVGPAVVLAYAIPAVNNATLTATFDFYEVFS